MRILLFLSIAITTLELSAQSQPIIFSVYFEKGKAEINPADLVTIDDFLALGKDSSYNSVFLKGYADPDGANASNMELSEQRVLSVSNKFYGKNYQIESKYYGETIAVNKNKTEAEKALNRRVDIILWTDYNLMPRNKKPQVFTFSPNRDIVLTGAEGTKIKIPAGSLVYQNGGAVNGDVTIELTEFYSMFDIIQQQLTTTSNGKVLESAGMINIEANRNGNELRLKGGAKMEIAFAERKENDGFGLFYGNEDPRTQVLNWTPAASPMPGDKEWTLSGAKLFISDTIETWRSKFEYNNMGQRIRVTEKWEAGKGISYDTLLMDKTINANKIILQATRLGWINCDQFYEDNQPIVELFVTTNTEMQTDIVLIFADRKGMILPNKNAQGQLVFSNVPQGERIIVTGVGSDEGKLYFAKQELTSNTTNLFLEMKETPIKDINVQLSSLN
jgi:hypothetical protein